jgi:hypothetical protein
MASCSTDTDDFPNDMAQKNIPDEILVIFVEIL